MFKAYTGKYDRITPLLPPGDTMPVGRKARAIFLKQHPLCAFCQAEGKIVPATVADHLIPHRGDQRLFWDQANWESLCKECHDRKIGSGL